MPITLREAWCKVADWCENPPWISAEDVQALIDDALDSEQDCEGVDTGGGDGDGDDDDGPNEDDFGDPAGRALVSDNCQDGANNAPFNLQIRNATNTATGWTMVWRNRPYSTIPGLTLPAGAQYDGIISNGDGTFDHVFSSTAPLSAFQSLTITGGVPTPAGDNDCGQVERFVK